MKNYLKIRDLVSLNYYTDSVIKVKDELLKSAGTSSIKSLRITVAASHSGIITKNNFFYLPEKMRDGAASFVTGYKKPILRHHKEEEDPIGRVVSASYVDSSQRIMDSYKGVSIRDNYRIDTDSYLDQAMKDFCEGRMPLASQIDFIRDVLNTPSYKDSNLILNDNKYGALGHIELVANVTDRDAIDKFLDGRYLTGSVTFKTDMAICSTCKQDWAKDSKCSHKPGTKGKDGKKNFLIAGNFSYEEWSPVNCPADEESQVLEIAIGDSVEKFDLELDKDQVSETRVNCSIELNSNNNKEESMSVENTATVSDSVAPTTITEQVDSVNTEQTTQEPAVEDLDAFFNRLLADDYKAQDGDEEKAYGFMVDELREMGFVEDATLSTEKRKSLPKSSFCGPERSFPVHDCAHVTAARRLVGRYKGPGNKDSILACVNRKAKAMGCDKMSDSKNLKDSTHHARMMHMVLSVIEEHMYNKKYNSHEEGEGDKDPMLTDEEMSTMSNVLKRLASVVGKDNFVKALSSEKSELKEDIKDYLDGALLDEIVSLEEKLGSLQDTNKSLKEEYLILTQEAEEIRNSLVTEKTKCHDLKADKLALLQTLQDKEYKEDRLTNLVKLSDEVLDLELGKVNIDVKRITDKLNDGMSRQPVGAVENPVPVVPSQADVKQNIVSTEELEIIKNNYMKMRFTNSIAAENYLRREMERIKQQNRLPVEK